MTYRFIFPNLDCNSILLIYLISIVWNTFRTRSWQHCLRQEIPSAWHHPIINIERTLGAEKNIFLFSVLPLSSLHSPHGALQKYWVTPIEGNNTWRSEMQINPDWKTLKKWINICMLYSPLLSVSASYIYLSVRCCCKVCILSLPPDS